MARICNPCLLIVAGFAAGAATGATGGFLGAAANSWYNGGSF